VEGGLLLDVVIRQGATIFQLFPGENQTLLIRRDALLILNFGLDIVNGVAGLDVECDGLTGERLHEDLHTTSEA